MSQPEGSPEPVDGLSFRLVMDGVYASIKLNATKPDRGMTKAQAEEHLSKWFPDAVIEVDLPEV